MDDYKGDLSPEQQDAAINLLVNFVPYFVVLWTTALVVLIGVVVFKIVRNKFKRRD